MYNENMHPDISCKNCNHEFKMGDKIFSLTLAFERWNVCEKCVPEVRERINSQLFALCIRPDDRTIAA